jgi:hypothetical protein
MRHRLPGLSVGLAASLRSMPTDYCEVLKSSSAKADGLSPCDKAEISKQRLREKCQLVGSLRTYHWDQEKRCQPYQEACGGDVDDGFKARPAPELL